MSTPKYDWYETDQDVVISIFVKNLKESDVKTDFSEQSFAFSCVTGSGDKFELNLKLTGEIRAQECSFRVSPVKVEIKLKKKANLRWSMLESKKTNLKENTPVVMNSVVSSSGDETATIKSYQDKVRLFEEEIKAVEEEEAKNEGVNELFKQIYSTSSDEVRKAMNKSFVESNGTVLSTNWKEVKEKPVEMKPGDGVDFKRYDS